MKTIYKWTLELKDTQTIMAPENTLFLTVQMQHGLPQVWGLCNPNLPAEKNIFHIRGTGHPVPEKDNLLYLGSFQMNEGQFVFHVFREI